MATTYGVYIHIPFCKSKCDYCDFYSLAGREEEMDHYQKALIAQLGSFAPRLKGRVADTIYFGGGTPSYYGEKRLRELLGGRLPGRELSPRRYHHPGGVYKTSLGRLSAHAGQRHRGLDEVYRCLSP